MDNYDVVQVGYGPVGQTMAALLAQSGHRVAVFERHRALYGLPRAAGVDHEIMRVLQGLGIADSFARRAVPVTGYCWLDTSWKKTFQMDLAHEMSGWPLANLLYQPELEDALDATVRACPTAEVNQGWEATEIRDAGEHVELTVKPRDGGATRTVRARYLVGADGANSFVREHARMGWKELGPELAFDTSWLVVDFRPNDPEAVIPNMPMLGHLTDPARPTFLSRRLGWKHCRWEFLLMPGDDRAEMERPETVWKLLSRWVTPKDGELVRHAVHAYRSGLADRWRKDRVLLVGDAAHLTPPLAGQGMCQGIRDVKNLAWKLDLVLRGRAKDALLDSYTAERKPHARAVINISIEPGRGVCVTDPAAAKARDAALVNAAPKPRPPFPGLVDGVLHRDAEGRPAAPAGQLSIQGIVELGARSGRFDDVVGPGFVVLGLDADPSAALDDAQRGFLETIGARVVQVSARHRPPAGVLSDLRNEYARWLRALGVTYVVVRPDFYVFGGATSPSGLSDVVASLQRQLA